MARYTGAWILEDDYDSEYRYSGRPLASLQGLDEHDRVLYLGTLSKVLFPSLRLGSMIAPPALVDAFANARALYGRHAPMLEQAVLAEFINEGHFARHIRRMRQLYAHRMEYFVARLQKDLPGILEVEPVEAGMQLIGWLPHGVDDQALSSCLREHGIVAAPLSVHYLAEAKLRPGLVLGFGGYDEQQIDNATRLMADVARDFLQSRTNGVAGRQRAPTAARATPGTAPGGGIAGTPRP